MVSEDGKDRFTKQENVLREPAKRLYNFDA